MNDLFLCTLKKIGPFHELLQEARSGDIIPVHPNGNAEYCEAGLDWRAFPGGVVVEGTDFEKDVWYFLNGAMVTDERGNVFRQSVYSRDSWHTNDFGFVVVDHGQIIQNGQYILTEPEDQDPDRDLYFRKDGSPALPGEVPHLIQTIEGWQALPNGILTRRGNTFCRHIVSGKAPFSLTVHHQEIGTFEATDDWLAITLGVLDFQGQDLLLNGKKCCVLPGGKCDNFSTVGTNTIAFTQTHEGKKTSWLVDTSSGRMQSFPFTESSPSRYSKREDGIHNGIRYVYAGPCERFEENDYGLIIEAGDTLFQLIP
ncbi:MAG: hypothetical protein WCV85_00245 [Patescibacteria group bacterium]|jgi:hypothetical protein